jgi:hypothetical protein
VLSKTDGDKDVPPDATEYHFIDVPVATKFDTLAHLPNKIVGMKHLLVEQYL